MTIIQELIQNQINILLEKVSKKDINTALKDSEIKVGLEFEFITDVYSSEWDYMDLTSQWLTFVNNCYEYYSDCAAKVEDYNITAENMKKEIDEYLYDLIKQEEDLKYKREFEILRNKISKLFDNNKIIELLENNKLIDFRDAKSNCSSLDTFIYEKMHKYENEIEYVDSLFYFPDMGDELTEYYNQVVDIDTNKIFDELKDEILELCERKKHRYTKFDIQNTITDFNLFLPDENTDAEITESMLSDELPRISGVEFDIKDDGSLRPDDGGFGVEVVNSNPISMDKAIETIEKMFTFIKNNGYTNNSCGFHISLSYPKRKPNLLKLMLMVDEGWVWKKFEERQNNNYTQSVYNNLLNKVKDLDLYSTELLKIYGDFLENTDNQRIIIPFAKYFGVNVVNSTYEGGRTEFRYLGGSDYQNKKDDIIQALGKFAYWLDVATSKKHESEYHKKVMKILLNNKNNKKSKLTPTQIKKIDILYSKLSNNMKGLLNVLLPNKLYTKRYKELIKLLNKNFNKKSNKDSGEQFKNILISISFISKNNADNYSKKDWDIVGSIFSQYGEDGLYYIITNNYKL